MTKRKKPTKLNLRKLRTLKTGALKWAVGGAIWYGSGKTPPS
jgi:hypothetical protein